MNQDLRTQVLLSTIQAQVQKQPVEDVSVSKVYDFVDSVMREESRRMYDRDIVDIDAFADTLRKYQEAEDWTSFKAMVAIVIAFYSSNSRMNTVIMSMIAKISEIAQHARYSTDPDVAQSVLKQIRIAREACLSARNAENK
jgi:hypothetical protein